MKNIITLNVLCLFFTILISACGTTNGSVTKRHYTKGYYVAHNMTKHKISSENKEKKIVHQNSEESTIVIPSKKIAKGGYVTNSNATNSAIDKTTLVANSSKKPIVFNTHIVSKHPLKSAPTFSKNNKHSINSKSSAASDEDDGLSLLWIVILVLLILWALGLISGGFGLGGFINILLVIALILLILWLLKII